jgi:hypothetical protein
METVYVPDVVVKLYGYLLPCLEAQVPKLQKSLALEAFHTLDHRHDFLFCVDQAVKIGVDLSFQAHYPDDDVLQTVRIESAATRHIRQG